MRERRLVDEDNRFEIFPNGHSQFLTRSAREKVRQGLRDDAPGGASLPNSIPEPDSEYGAGKRIVTLRLRALPGCSIPELLEGNFIAAKFRTQLAEEGDSPFYSTVDEYVRRTGYRQFRVLDIYWGTQSYVNLMVDGAAARRAARSTSDKNAYAICELIMS